MNYSIKMKNEKCKRNFHIYMLRIYFTTILLPQSYFVQNTRWTTTVSELGLVYLEFRNASCLHKYMYLQQNDHQDEKKKVGDEEDSNTNIAITSESNSDTSTTPSSDFHDDSGNNENDQDLTNTERTINSNIQIIGQVSQTL